MDLQFWMQGRVPKCVGKMFSSLEQDQPLQCGSWWAGGRHLEKTRRSISDEVEFPLQCLLPHHRNPDRRPQHSLFKAGDQRHHRARVSVSARILHRTQATCCGIGYTTRRRWLLLWHSTANTWDPHIQTACPEGWPVQDDSWHSWCYCTGNTMYTIIWYINRGIVLYIIYLMWSQKRAVKEQKKPFMCDLNWLT